MSQIEQRLINHFSKTYSKRISDPDFLQRDGSLTYLISARVFLETLLQKNPDEIVASELTSIDEKAGVSIEAVDKDRPNTYVFTIAGKEASASVHEDTGSIIIPPNRLMSQMFLSEALAVSAVLDEKYGDESLSQMYRNFYDELSNETNISRRSIRTKSKFLSEFNHLDASNFTNKLLARSASELCKDLQEVYGLYQLDFSDEYVAVDPRPISKSKFLTAFIDFVSPYDRESRKLSTNDFIPINDYFISSRTLDEYSSDEALALLSPKSDEETYLYDLYKRIVRGDEAALSEFDLVYKTAYGEETSKAAYPTVVANVIEKYEYAKNGYPRDPRIFSDMDAVASYLCAKHISPIPSSKIVHNGLMTGLPVSEIDGLSEEENTIEASL